MSGLQDDDHQVGMGIHEVLLKRRVDEPPPSTLIVRLYSSTLEEQKVSLARVDGSRGYQRTINTCTDS